MGTIYARGEWLWMGFRGPDGRWHYKSTGYRVGEEKKAQAELAAIEEGIKKGQRSALLGSLSVAEYGEQWCSERQARGLWNAKKEWGRVKKHALPIIGKLRLEDVRPMHMRELLVRWRQAKQAPRSIANLYGSLHRLFADAVAEERIETNPVIVPKAEMPKRRDKNPMWRATAVFTREEAELLIGSPKLELDRRLLFALGFLGGLREGEIGALQWLHFDSESEPLGRLSVVGSYSRVHKQVKCTKSDMPREVPVHPTLAKLLAEWKLSGWSAHYFEATGKRREPKPEDLLLPSRAITHLTDLSVGDATRRSLEQLGMRPRRFHDTRRTFISLARTDGAARDVLRCVTHGAPKGDIIDQYTTFTWEALCAAVKALKASPRGAATTKFTTAKGA